MNRLYFLIIVIICIIYIINEIRKKRFSIKESFWWMSASLTMVFLAIFPYSIDWFAHIFGVEYPPSLLFVFCILFLLFINFRNSKKISEHQMKITELAQELSILKEKENNNNEKK